MSVRTPASAWPRWLAGWFGAAAIAMINGIARGMLYERRVGPMRAHYISTGTLLAFLSAYMAALSKMVPDSQPWQCGSNRTRLDGDNCRFRIPARTLRRTRPWAKLFEQYDVRRGYVWILIPLWTAIGPAALREVMRR
jgi:hypothetical protein